MNELKQRIKNFTPKGKNKAAIVVCVVSLALLLMWELASTDNESSNATNDAHIDSAQYTKQLEKQLTDILGEVDGAGEVQVMITLDSYYENVYAKGYSAKNETDGDSAESDTSEEYIVIKNGSNTEECVVIKVYEPQVKGVAVVAEGAGNIQVKTAITETVCALFNISSAKVSVIKGYKE